MKIAVITDSSSNLSFDYVKTIENLDMMPLMISYEDKYYRDQIEIDYSTVYKNLADKSITTSLPDLGDFDKSIKKFISKGYTDIIVITISSKLSGTYNAFKVAAEEYIGIKIHMYDSKTLSMALGYIVQEAIQSIKSNYSIPEIIGRLDDLRYNNSIALYTVETLKYLRKGGRIGKVEGTIGDILAIKPIISVNDDGVYYTMSKAFGINRALITMRNIVKKKYKNDLIDVTIHYGTSVEKAQKVSKRLNDDLHVRNMNIVQLTPVLGVHTGPEIIAIIVRKV